MAITRYPDCGCDAICADCRLGRETVKDSWIASRTSPAFILQAPSDGPPLEWGIASTPGGTFAMWQGDRMRFEKSAEPPEGAMRYAWFELTLSCPHRCRHCYLGDRLGYGHAPLHALETAFSRLAEFQVSEIVLAGGEPTMHPKFLTILSLARRSAGKVRVLTNGWTQLPEVISALAQPGVSIEVPLLGWGESHDWMTRTRRSFQRVTQSMRLYREAGLDLKLTATLTRQVQDAMEQFSAFAEELGIPFETSDLMRQGHAEEFWDEIAPR